jgi:hypothetical protein
MVDAIEWARPIASSFVPLERRETLGRLMGPGRPPEGTPARAVVMLSSVG